MSIDLLKKEFVPKYKAVGEQKFYSFLLSYAVNKIMLISKRTYRGVVPNLEFLDYCNKFLVLYRREGEDIYLEIARLFRKAAHKIYRLMLKKEMIGPDNQFLNLVQNASN